MALEPPRRVFPQQQRRKGLRDGDAAGRAQKLRAWGWSLYAGIPFGVGIGLLMGHLVLGVLLGPVVIYSVVVGITTIFGRGASVLYMPSGSTTPRRREYSRARALEVRGEYEEAIRAYEAEILEGPRAAEPFLRIARIFRDDLKDLDSAEHWFRRAQREGKLSSGEAIRVHRELAEIFLHLRKEPRRAAPELARLVEGYAHTPDGRWAARELAEIKEEMARELEEPPRDL
jgi:tetratricopeptide (TPR) repeat protein